MNGLILRNIIAIVAVLALVAAVAVYRNQPSPSTSKPAGVPTTQRGQLPRMLDLGADKCVPCKKMAPILAELRTEYAGRAEIDFIDVWKDPQAGEPYDIRVIPTQIFFDAAGNEVWRHEGSLSRAEIVSKLKQMGVG